MSARGEFKNRQELVRFLQDKATDIRKKIIKLTVIAGGGHVGGALSMTDILIVLYNHVLRIDPQNPKWEERDRFILSKGHGALCICPVLCDVGFYEECTLDTFNQLDSPFGMHPDMNKIPGIEMSTGSLGHGLSVAVGAAISGKMDRAKWRVYVLLGDGECNEGTVWEAAMCAAHYKLGNLVCIVDRNKLMIDGFTESVMGIEPFCDKWDAFGWQVREMDGHDFNQLIDVFESLPPVDSEVPTVIIANTVKGKGVSYMENEPKWHYGGLDSEMEQKALEDIEKMRPR
ncbi:MAG: transketolase [bacterium]